MEYTQYFINIIKTMKHSQSTKSDIYKGIGCNKTDYAKNKTTESKKICRGGEDKQNTKTIK